MIQRHQPTRVQIGNRGARVVGDTVDCAGSLPKVDDRIKFPLGPYVQRSASQISPRSNPVFSKLSLNGEVPGVPRGCLSVRIHHEIISTRIKFRIVILAGDVRCGKWLSTGIVLPGIIETTNRKSKSDAWSPGRG